MLRRFGYRAWTAHPQRLHEGRSHSLLGAVLLVVGVAAFATIDVGCSDSAQAPKPVVGPIDAAGVGPAPLRRLSNSEYLNVLADLFPGLTLTLPPLPADSEVAGFSNAAEAQQPSDVRIARVEQIANLYATALTADAPALRSLTGCAYATPTEATACEAKFISESGARIYRRPLSAEEQDRLTVRFDGWKSDVDFVGAVQLTLSAMLQAPQFLYRPEVAPTATNGQQALPVEPYAMASRLSFFFWESGPDDALLLAASKNELQTADQIKAQATRLLADPRARRSLWSFHRQWLGIDRILTDEHTFRTPEVDDKWSTGTPAAASRESQWLVENVLGGGGTLRDLLLSRRAFVNGDLARIYGVQAPTAPDAFSEVLLPETERAGILTRVAFLAGFSHRGATSPPVRGNGLGLHLLCSLPISPPPGVDLSQPVTKPGDGPKTNRTLFEERTASSSCIGCHRQLNGVGFGFEHYNAAGKFQTEEQGLSINTKTELVGVDVEREYDGAIALSQALSESQDVFRCATQQWVRYALGRAPADNEQALVKQVGSNFIASQGDIRQLMLDLVTAPTFRLQRSVSNGGGGQGTAP